MRWNNALLHSKEWSCIDTFKLKLNLRIYSLIVNLIRIWRKREIKPRKWPVEVRLGKMVLLTRWRWPLSFPFLSLFSLRLACTESQQLPSSAPVSQTLSPQPAVEGAAIASWFRRSLRRFPLQKVHCQIAVHDSFLNRTDNSLDWRSRHHCLSLWTCQNNMQTFFDLRSHYILTYLL